MAILPVPQLPRYLCSVSSVMQCKSSTNKSVKREILSYVEVPVSEREGLESLENCLEKWLAEKEVQDWKCTSCSQYGSGVRKLVPEAVPELLIVQLKHLEKFTQLRKFRSKLNNSLREDSDRGQKLCNQESSILGHYTTAMKLKKRWWNCYDAVIESMEER